MIGDLSLGLLVWCGNIAADQLLTITLHIDKGKCKQIISIIGQGIIRMEPQLSTHQCLWVDVIYWTLIIS